MTTAAQDRYIKVRHLQDLFTTATSTASSIPGMRKISMKQFGAVCSDAEIITRRPVLGVILFSQNTTYRQNIWLKYYRY